MNTVSGYAMSSWDTGYGDFVMRPDLSTLRLLPWQPGSAMVICDLEWEDGTPAVFVLPVEVELGTRTGSRFVRVELDERRERFELPCAEEPRFVRFDAHGWIPKRVDEDKPLEEWLAIAEMLQALLGGSRAT